MARRRRAGGRSSRRSPPSPTPLASPSLPKGSKRPIISIGSAPPAATGGRAISSASQRQPSEEKARSTKYEVRTEGAAGVAVGGTARRQRAGAVPLRDTT